MALTKIKGAGINISATEKLYFDGGGNTYIHESAADVLKLVVGGVAFMDATEGTNAIVFNEGSVDMDFRVESNGNANMIFVDGGNDRVGIGTASPTDLLEIASSTTPALAFNDTGGGADSKVFRLSGGGDKFFFEGRNDANTGDGDAGTIMTFDLTNSNVGIGTASPIANLDILGDEEALVVRTGDSGRVGIALKNTTTGSDVNFTDGFILKLDSDESAHIIQSHDNYMAFHTNGSERMRILSGGAVCIARTSVLSPTAKLVVSAAADGGTTPAMSVQANTSTSSGSVIVFHSGDGGECGSIGMSDLNAANAVAFNTSSDYRLKQKVKTLPNGLDRVNQMKPVEFEWKKTKDKSEGFIAHELQEICDYAVMGEKDGDRMQQVDYAKITPILVKAVQELSAEVEKLKNG